MPTLQLTDEQVVELVKQLPPDRRRAALLALAAGATEQRQERMLLAEERLRVACAERGLNWDKMSEPEREAFADNLVHEGRPCRR